MEADNPQPAAEISAPPKEGVFDKWFTRPNLTIFAALCEKKVIKKSDLPRRYHIPIKQINAAVDLLAREGIILVKKRKQSVLLKLNRANNIARLLLKIDSSLRGK